MSGFDPILAQARHEGAAGSPNTINVQLIGEKLDKKDTFGKGGKLHILYILRNAKNIFAYLTPV